MPLRALVFGLAAAALCAVAPAALRASTPLEVTRRLDHAPPHVVALKSGGHRGTKIRLLYRVTDASGRSSEKVTVFAGRRVLTRSRWAPFGPARGKLYYFEFPTSASMSGTYTFCVQSRDPSGNVSKPSCARLVLS
jgi:hypothetical protein